MPRLCHICHVRSYYGNGHCDNPSCPRNLYGLNRRQRAAVHEYLFFRHRGLPIPAHVMARLRRVLMRVLARELAAEEALLRYQPRRNDEPEREPSVE